MKFSVLMSVYGKDRPAWLKESLESVFSQTLKADEVVLVIDGPIGGDLREVIDHYCHLHPELNVAPLAENGGLGKALNHGLDICSNDIIIRMDADDISLPERFENLINTFERFPEVDAVSSWIDEFEDEPENIVSSRKLPEFPYELGQFARDRCPLNHPASAFKKSSILLAGGYRHLPLYEDYYLWARMLKSGFKMYNIQRSLLLMRTSSDMYNRRGGWKYARYSLNFLSVMHQMGFISRTRQIKLALIRTTVCIIPGNIRKFIYRKILR
ncbi:MAG: glycosyltransferase [Bacteroidales bacterium]|nr:glycosyltransferase [Bacteroidales bacterium]MBD5282053.1 glycosyltransferase [Bacteroides sp.]MDE6033375.1 glycosyltransferase [Muribaculaceae bacterium]MBD5342614.1 glycosyltransferase [Bacteroides sp.]MBD5351701.1 glycosyltransferase [Bacteroides sp.]